MNVHHPFVCASGGFLLIGITGPTGPEYYRDFYRQQLLLYRVKNGPVGPANAAQGPLSLCWQKCADVDACRVEGNGTETHSLAPPACTGCKLAWMPSEDHISILNLESGEEMTRLSPPDGDTGALAWSSSGRCAHESRAVAYLPMSPLS